MNNYQNYVLNYLLIGLHYEWVLIRILFWPLPFMFDSVSECVLLFQYFYFYKSLFLGIQCLTRKIGIPVVLLFSYKLSKKAFNKATLSSPVSSRWRQQDGIMMLIKAEDEYRDIALINWEVGLRPSSSILNLNPVTYILSTFENSFLS